MVEMTAAETNATLAGAPGTVEVKGKTYLVDKTNTAQIFAFYEWALKVARKTYNPFRDVCDSLQGLPVSEEQKHALLLQAHSVKFSGDVPNSALTDALRSCAGVAFQFWILTRKHHPELTLEAANGMIDENNRIDVYADLDEASGANTINKALISAGFFPPAPPDSKAG